MNFTKSLCVAVAALCFAAGSAQSKDIVQVAQSTGKFNTLLAAAKAAGLVGALRGHGPLTVFAPTDAAFKRLPAGTVKSLLKRKNRSKLAAILKYHVLPRKLTSGMLPHGRIAVRTLNHSSRLHIRNSGHGVRVNNARVVSANVRADNGVIHVINRVLLPK